MYKKGRKTNESRPAICSTFTIVRNSETPSRPTEKKRINKNFMMIEARDVSIIIPLKMFGLYLC